MSGLERSTQLGTPGSYEVRSLMAPMVASLRRNGTTVCRNRLRSGAAVSGSRWLSVADASTSTERAARDLRAGDEAPARRAARGRAVRSVCSA